MVNGSRSLPGIRWKVGVDWIISSNKSSGVLVGNVEAVFLENEYTVSCDCQFGRHTWTGRRLESWQEFRP